jgi:hypothetical protein
MKHSKMALVGHSVTLFGNVASFSKWLGISMSKLGPLVMKIRNRLQAISRLMTQKNRKKAKTCKELDNPSREPLPHLC